MAFDLSKPVSVSAARDIIANGKRLTTAGSARARLIEHALIRVGAAGATVAELIGWLQHVIGHAEFGEFKAASVSPHVGFVANGWGALKRDGRRFTVVAAKGRFSESERTTAVSVVRHGTGKRAAEAAEALAAAEALKQSKKGAAKKGAAKKGAAKKGAK